MTFYLRVVIEYPDPKFIANQNWIAWDSNKCYPGHTCNIESGKTVYGRTGVAVTGGSGKIKIEIYNDTDNKTLDSKEYTVTPPVDKYWTGNFTMPNKDIDVKFNTYYWDGSRWVLNDWVGCKPGLLFRLRRFVRHLFAYKLQIVRE